MYKINNLSKYELGDNQSLLDDFLKFAIQRFEVNKPFKIMLVTDSENAQNPLGKTGAYNPATSNIYIYTDGRIFKDVLRSIAHEVFHHSQNCKGEFDNHDLALAPGYAQEDDYMREIERGAYEQGNLALRDWEDGKKKVRLKLVKEQGRATCPAGSVATGEKDRWGNIICKTLSKKASPSDFSQFMKKAKASRDPKRLQRAQDFLRQRGREDPSLPPLTRDSLSPHLKCDPKMPFFHKEKKSCYPKCPQGTVPERSKAGLLCITAAESGNLCMDIEREGKTFKEVPAFEGETIPIELAKPQAVGTGKLSVGLIGYKCKNGAAVAPSPEELIKIAIKMRSYDPLTKHLIDPNRPEEKNNLLLRKNPKTGKMEPIKYKTAKKKKEPVSRHRDSDLWKQLSPKELEKGDMANKIRSAIADQVIRKKVIQAYINGKNYDCKKLKGDAATKQQPCLTEDQILTSLYAIKMIKSSQEKQEAYDEAEIMNFVLDIAGILPVPGDPVDLVNSYLYWIKWTNTKNWMDLFDFALTFGSFFLIGQPFKWGRTLKKAVGATPAAIFSGIGPRQQLALKIYLREVALRMKQWLPKLHRRWKTARFNPTQTNEAANAVLRLSDEIGKLQKGVDTIRKLRATLTSGAYAKHLKNPEEFNKFLRKMVEDMPDSYAGLLVGDFEDVFKKDNLKRLSRFMRRGSDSPQVLEGAAKKLKDVYGSDKAGTAGKKFSDIIDETLKSGTAEDKQALTSFYKMWDLSQGATEEAQALNYAFPGISTMATWLDDVHPGWLDKIESAADLQKYVNEALKKETFGRFDADKAAIIFDFNEDFYKFITGDIPIAADMDGTALLQKTLENNKIKTAIEGLKGETSEEKLIEFVNKMAEMYRPRHIEGSLEKIWGSLYKSELLRKLKGTAVGATFMAAQAAKATQWSWNNFAAGAFKRFIADPAEVGLTDNVIQQLDASFPKWGKRARLSTAVAANSYRRVLRHYFRDVLLELGDGYGANEGSLGYGNSGVALAKLAGSLKNDGNIPKKVRANIDNLEKDFQSKDIEKLIKARKAIIIMAIRYQPKEYEKAAKEILSDLKNQGVISPAAATLTVQRGEGERRELLKQKKEEDAAKTKKTKKAGEKRPSVDPLRFIPGDLVKHEGLYWEAKNDNTDSEPIEGDGDWEEIIPDTTYFAQLAKSHEYVDKDGTVDMSQIKNWNKATGYKGHRSGKQGEVEPAELPTMVTPDAEPAPLPDPVTQDVKPEEKPEEKAEEEPEEEQAGAEGDAKAAAGKPITDRDIPPGLGKRGARYGLVDVPLINKQNFNANPPVVSDRATKRVVKAIKNFSKGWLYRDTKGDAVQIASRLQTAFREAGWPEYGTGGTNGTVIKCLARAPSEDELKNYIKKVSLKTVKYKDKDKIEVIKNTWKCPAFLASAAPKVIKAKVRKLAEAVEPDINDKDIVKLPIEPKAEDQTLKKVLEDYHESESEKRFKKLVKGVTK